MAQKFEASKVGVPKAQTGKKPWQLAQEAAIRAFEKDKRAREDAKKEREKREQKKAEYVKVQHAQEHKEYSKKDKDYSKKEKEYFEKFGFEDTCRSQNCEKYQNWEPHLYGDGCVYLLTEEQKKKKAEREAKWEASRLKREEKKAERLKWEEKMAIKKEEAKKKWEQENPKQARALEKKLAEKVREEEAYQKTLQRVKETSEKATSKTSLKKAKKQKQDGKKQLHEEKCEVKVELEQFVKTQDEVFPDVDSVGESVNDNHHGSYDDESAEPSEQSSSITLELTQEFLDSLPQEMLVKLLQQQTKSNL